MSYMQQWLKTVDKRPPDRCGFDLDVIYTRLQRVKAFRRFHPLMLQQVAYFGYYEQLDAGVTLFHQGDVGTNWYAVLSGKLEVRASETGNNRESTTLCILGPGSSFGDSVLTNKPRLATLVTCEPCEIFRLERDDYVMLCMRNKRLLESTGSSQAVGAFEGFRLLNSRWAEAKDYPLPPPSPPDKMWQMRASSSATVTAAAAPSAADCDNSIYMPVPSAVSAPNLGGICEHGVVETIADLARAESTGRLPSGVVLAVETIAPNEPLPEPGTLSRSASRRSLILDGSSSLSRHHPQTAPNPPVIIFSSDLPTGPPFSSSKQMLNRTTVHKNPADTVFDRSSDSVFRISRMLRTLITSRYPGMIRDRKYHQQTHRSCMVGTEMVDWLIQQCEHIQSRAQAAWMWQVLLESGQIVHVSREQYFQDRYQCYRFSEDDAAIVSLPSVGERREALDSAPSSLSLLLLFAPEAMLRVILRKQPRDRSAVELEIICEELRHLASFAYLSTSLRRRLAPVVRFEAHLNQGVPVFERGDKADAWYTIFSGCVDVMSEDGSHVITTLKDGDDFGKMALVSDDPRKNSVVLKSSYAHLLKVAKLDFRRILYEIEANTIRVQEDGIDVFVIERLPDGRKAILAGTDEKIFEYLLDHCISTASANTLSATEAAGVTATDPQVADLLIAMPAAGTSKRVVSVLFKLYLAATQMMQQYGTHWITRCPDTVKGVAIERKRAVVEFVRQWVYVTGDAIWQDETVSGFVSELAAEVCNDANVLPALTESLSTARRLCDLRDQALSIATSVEAQQEAAFVSRQNFGAVIRPIRTNDEFFFKLFSINDSCTQMTMPVDTTVRDLIVEGAKCLDIDDQDLILVELRSSGEKVVFEPADVGVFTRLTPNGRLYLVPSINIDDLLVTPMPAPQPTFTNFHIVSSRDVAYTISVQDWELFNCIHEHELLYAILGRDVHNRSTPNLDRFLRRFYELQFWTAGEILVQSNPSRRAALLRKFIKISILLREYHNLNACFAIVMGLANPAVARISNTWSRVPNRMRHAFAELEMLVDPARDNHPYRRLIARLHPPVIPSVPLHLRQLADTRALARSTYNGNLLNFEKISAFAAPLRLIRFSRSQPLTLQPPIGFGRWRDYLFKYFMNLQVIDSQLMLNQLSHCLQPSAH